MLPLHSRVPSRAPWGGLSLAAQVPRDRHAVQLWGVRARVRMPEGAGQDEPGEEVRNLVKKKSLRAAWKIAPEETWDCLSEGERRREDPKNLGRKKIYVQCASHLLKNLTFFTVEKLRLRTITLGTCSQAHICFAEKQFSFHFSISNRQKKTWRRRI